MACTSCKKKKGKGIGALSSSDKAELAEAAWIASGAVLSKMVVNPLAKAIFGEKNTKNAPGLTKLMISGALWYTDTKESRAMAKGAGAVGVLDLLDKHYPKIFQQFLPQDGRTLQTNPGIPAPAAANGIHGGVILDLNNIEGIGYMSMSNTENEMGNGTMF